MDHFPRAGHEDTAVNKTDVALELLEVGFYVTQD